MYQTRQIDEYEKLYSMKLVIQKTFTATIDTSTERERIRKSFADDEQTQSKLNRLMDAIENQDWQGARKQLESKWWHGRDKKHECPRVEFIGHLFKYTEPLPDGFDFHASYMDLVYRFNSHPDNYKVLNVIKDDEPKKKI